MIQKRPSKDAADSLKRLARHDSLTGLQVGRIVILNTYRAINIEPPLGNRRDFLLLYSKITDREEKRNLLYYQAMANYAINAYNYIREEVLSADAMLSYTGLLRNDIAHGLSINRFKWTNDYNKVVNTPYYYSNFEDARLLYKAYARIAQQDIEVFNIITKAIRKLTKDRRLDKFNEPFYFRRLKQTIAQFNHDNAKIRANDKVASRFDQVDAQAHLLITPIYKPEGKPNTSKVKATINFQLSRSYLSTSSELAGNIIQLREAIYGKPGEP